MFKIYKCTSGIYIESKDGYHKVTTLNWDELVAKKELFNRIIDLLEVAESVSSKDFSELNVLAPIGSQEVWASGVTYKRSKEARMEESERSRGDYFYEKVYDAERPELFFKATPNRVSGPGGNVHMRKDSDWNVPEPELTLLISSDGTIEGYTIGNDMSSRSIEGENPLYLPQAKTYDKSAAIGPCILTLSHPISIETEIRLEIDRGSKKVFDDSIQLISMKRKFEELVSYLFRECSFPTGCYLMTGTGLVPDSGFTLASGDIVTISIDGIGTLTNTVSTRG